MNQPLKILPSRLFDEDKINELRRLYLEECNSAKECAKQLGLTSRQVRSKVYRLGWSQIRTQVGARALRRCEQSLTKKVTNMGTELAPMSTPSNDAYIEDVVDKARRVADKGFEMAEDAANPRDLNSAIQAASKAVTMYRQSKGIDSQGSPAPGAFNIFFGQHNELPLTAAGC